MYNKVTQEVSDHSFNIQPCSGIAVDGHNLYLMFDQLGEIDLWTDLNFGIPSRIFPPQIKGSATMAVDSLSHELFVVDSSGQLFEFTPGARPHLLTANLNGATSIGIGRDHLLITSGSTWACFGRERSRVQQHRSCLDMNIHGNFSSARVDEIQNAWFLDKNTRELIGPYLVH